MSAVIVTSSFSNKPAAIQSPVVKMAFIPGLSFILSPALVAKWKLSDFITSSVNFLKM
ncbi:hypothetical protein ES703_77238 [subsurface metagenome]